MEARVTAEHIHDATAGVAAAAPTEPAATRRVRATGLDGGVKGGGGAAYAGGLVGERRSAQLRRRLRPFFRVGRSLGIYSLTLYGGSPSTVREIYPEGAPWVILSYFMHRDRRSIRSRE